MRISDWSSDVCSSDLTKNEFLDTRIDDRDLYSVRGSLRWEPSPDTTIDLMASYIHERDKRTRIQKQLCQRDPTGILGCLNSRLDNSPFNGNATFTAALTSKEFLAIRGIPNGRSEEHTSELQSLVRNSYAVFCLTT